MPSSCGVGVATGASGIPQRHARAETDGARVTGDQPRRGTFAPMGRFNTQRLHSHLGDTPPTEFEEAYAARQADHARVGNQ